MTLAIETRDAALPDTLLAAREEARRKRDREQEKIAALEAVAQQESWQALVKAARASLGEDLWPFASLSIGRHRFCSTTRAWWVQIILPLHWPLQTLFVQSCGEWLRSPVYFTSDRQRPVDGYQGQDATWLVVRHEHDTTKSLAQCAVGLGAALLLAEMTPEEVETEGDRVNPPF